jgi:hypothetical protein
VEVIGGGSVINGATPSSFITAKWLFFFYNVDLIGLILRIINIKQHKKCMII